MLVILGATGFVGGSITRFLDRQRISYGCMSRPQFDIGSEPTYSCLGQFGQDVHIVDCIARIDGPIDGIRQTNITGFRKWVQFVQARGARRYTYFSTYSTLLPEHCATSAYVESKRLAESILLNAIPTSTIVRLAFPFGVGESPRRLVSRLITQVKTGKPFEIDDFMTNLTPIGELMEDLPSLLDRVGCSVNYAASNLTSIREIVDYISGKLKISPNYSVSTKTHRIEVVGNIKTGSDKDRVFAEIDRMLAV